MRLPLVFAVLVLACTPASSTPPAAPPLPNSPPPPTAVAGMKVTAGKGFSCAVAADGRARCWGRNHLGQLGNGTRADTQSKPTYVADLTDVVSVGAGSNHACALQKSGRVACWGWSEAS